MPQFWIETVWLVPCYSLLGALLTIPWSPGILSRTGPRPAGYINLLMTFFSFVHSAIALVRIWGHPAQQVSLTWLQVANLDLTLPLEISALSIGAMALVTGLNVMAQLYAVGYMEMDWGWARFFGFLAFFEALNVLDFSRNFVFSLPSIRGAVSLEKSGVTDRDSGNTINTDRY